MSDTDPENDSETCCKMCGHEYELREGEDPTEFCDHCAHKRVEELEREVNEACSNVEKCLKEFTPLLAEREKLRAELEKVRDSKIVIHDGWRSDHHEGHCSGIIEGLISERDKWQAMAKELAEAIGKTVIPTGPPMFRYIEEQKALLARFTELEKSK